jgi:serine/threonine-protein kinase HipA
MPWPMSAPLVRQAMLQHPGFEDVGKRMLLAWSEGVQGLRDQAVYAAGDWAVGDACEGLWPAPKQKAETAKVGQSPLLGKR